MNLHYNFFSQLERVKRYFSKIRSTGKNQIDYEDDLMCFFINSWHLNDWVWNEIGNKLNFKNQKDFQTMLLKNYPNIAIAYDIANRRKHYLLKNPSPMNANYKANVKVRLPMLYVLTTEKDIRNQTQQVHGEYNYLIVSKDKDKEYDVLKLGKDIIKDWEKIISDCLIYIDKK